MYRKISLIVRCTLLGLSLASCAGKEEINQEEMPVSFVNVHHTTINIPINATYQWSEGFKRQAPAQHLQGVDMWELLKEGIESEMHNKGYRKATATEIPDIEISFIAALTSDLNDQDIQQQYGLVPGLVTHQNAGHSYEKGTLIFDVINPQTGQLAWRTAGQALASLDKISLDQRRERINYFVQKLLIFLPDAK